MGFLALSRIFRVLGGRAYSAAFLLLLAYLSKISSNSLPWQNILIEQVEVTPRKDFC